MVSWPSSLLDIIVDYASRPMTLAFDAQFLEAAAQAVADGLPLFDKASRDDWRTLRAVGDAALLAIEATLPPHDEIERSDVVIAAPDGAELVMRWYRPAVSPDPAGAEPPAGRGGPAALYVHGGGMISGSIDRYDRWIAGYASESGVPMLAADYRLAPEHPHPVPVEDAFAALAWLIDHAAEHGVDPARVAVMGDSAGGGIAAAVALLARDRSVPLARQLLVYPMLDDRSTVPDAELAPFAGWSYDDNYTGWHALLGDLVGGDGVPATAAPARAGDLSHLAPAYLDVGELDIFRNECLHYAQRLLAAGTPVELHVHGGCPHGFDRFLAAPVAQRARADRIRVLRSL
jgi:acetyl esterase/lipase